MDTIKNATEFQDGDDQTLLKDLESGTKEASGKYAHPSELTIIDCDSKENADEKTTLSADKNDSNSRVDSGGDPDCKIDLSHEIDD